MSEVIQWQGSNVDVRARLAPRYLWSTASIDVFLDGQCILATGGQLNLTGSHSATFSHSGKTHKAKLSWGRGSSSGWFPYQFQIDGSPVSESRVYVQNRTMVLMVKLALLVLMAVLLGVEVYHFHYRYVKEPELERAR